MTVTVTAPNLLGIMTDSLSISIAQLDPTVGDIAGNLSRLRDAWREAATSGADLVVASELFIAGYPPEDLVLKPAFVDACMAAVGTCDALYDASSSCSRSRNASVGACACVTGAG